MTTATAPTRTIQYNPWAQPLYQFPSPYDYRIVEGGRGSSKTHEITQALTVLGHQQPLRIGIGREHLKSIDESAKPELEDRMRSLGLVHPDAYRISKTAIDHDNGTHMFFVGLSKMSEEDIKGLAMLDILWIEEGHRMSHSSWKLIYPTIRKANAEIWISFNPQYRYQVAWELAQRKHDPTFWIKHVTWRDNAFFTARNNRDRLRDHAEKSLEYDHIWEGVPDDAGAAKKVLPYSLIRTCVEAWERRPKRGVWGTGGFDVADTGADSNALALRVGPELFHLEQWRGSQEYTIVESTQRVCQTAYANGIDRIDYDAGGVGSGCRGIFRDWIRKNPGKSLYANGCQFGGAVQGGDVIFERRRPRSILNNQMFANWQSQAGFVLRQRADNTSKLMHGESIDPHKCLFVNPEIQYLEDVCADLSQAEWSDETGKYRIDKTPRGPGEPEPPSPDAFDSVRLAFSTDARHGLRQIA